MHSLRGNQWMHELLNHPYHLIKADPNILFTTVSISRSVAGVVTNVPLPNSYTVNSECARGHRTGIYTLQKVPGRSSGCALWKIRGSLSFALS